MSDEGIAELKKYMRLHMELPSHADPSWRYKSYAEFVLTMGEAFTSAPLPEGVTRGEPGICYANAMRLASASNGKLLYVEGYGAGVFPMPHAWCVTTDGVVVDPTWAEPEKRHYYGVVFDTAEAWETLTKQGFFGLIPYDHLNGHPLLRYGDLRGGTGD